MGREMSGSVAWIPSWISIGPPDRACVSIVYASVYSVRFRVIGDGAVGPVKSRGAFIHSDPVVSILSIQRSSNSVEFLDFVAVFP
nr:hypothetical protein Iba_chr01eCG5090 [Ipomoea batatas]